MRAENASKSVGDTHSDISLPIGLFKSREQNFDTLLFDPFAGANNLLSNTPLEAHKGVHGDWDRTFEVGIHGQWFD